MPSEKKPSDSTDPRVLRAVAHPLRIELLTLLRRDGPLTASQCAQLLDVTPKICSYHLTLLGRYGLVEETGEGKGRARPWRLATAGLSYVNRPNEASEDSAAADQLARTLLARDARLIEEFITHRHALSKSWRNVATMSSNPLRLDSSQLRDLRSELLAVLDRYSHLSQSSSDDARPVHVALYAVPVDLNRLPPGSQP